MSTNVSLTSTSYSTITGKFQLRPKCFSFQAFTSCELISWKILMHVAVDNGAKIDDRVWLAANRNRDLH